MSRRIVIVGAGAAGVYTAYRLRQTLGEDYELVLLEGSSRIGGNAMVASVDGESVECGAQFFHPGAQPSFMALLEQLDLWDSCRIIRAPAGFTIWDRPSNRRLMHLPAHVAAFRGLRAGDWARATKFGLFIAYCYALETWGRDWTLSVDAWLGGMRLLDDEFKQILRLFLYQFVSLPRDRIGEASAKYAITYFVRTMFDAPRGAAPGVPAIDSRRTTFETYQSLTGLHHVHETVLAAANVQARLDTPVRAVKVDPGGGVVVVTDEGRLAADHVVLATDPHTSANILETGTTTAPDLLGLLRGLEYARLPISMQRGAPAHMPGLRSDWQPFNTIADDDDVMFSVWFGPMRKSGLEVFKSWGSPRLHPASSPSEFLAHEHFVPLPTTAFMRDRQQVLQRWQGDRGVWFAGGWTRWFDSQEAALVSADAVTAGIARAPLRSAPATDTRSSAQALLHRCGLPDALRDVEAEG